ncbi:MAG: response regulator transcription factor [Ignavibacteriaceae bacterium]|nr:response regulator transcription factor [Ignavibacteriaceae bacterium]
MSKDIKIFIADDHPIFREGLIKILEREKGYRICGVAANGDEALASIIKLKPDIAILDISMPGLSGIEIAKKLKEIESATHPVILTMYNDEEYLEAALENGVTGYLLKDSTLTEIIDCIRSVLNGGYFVSRQLQSFLVSGTKHSSDREKTSKLLENLTPTERQVLRLLSQNKTSVQIAKEMFVSYRTVQNHRMNISHKLGITGHNSLLMFAIENHSLL